MYNARLYSLCARWEVQWGGTRRVYRLTQLWVCWVIVSLCLNVKYQVTFFNWVYLVVQNSHLPSSLKVNAHGRRIRFKPQELIKMFFSNLIYSSAPCQLWLAVISPACTLWTQRRSMCQKPSARSNTCSCLSPPSRSPSAPWLIVYGVDVRWMLLNALF